MTTSCFHTFFNPTYQSYRASLILAYSDARGALLVYIAVSNIWLRTVILLDLILCNTEKQYVGF